MSSLPTHLHLDLDSCDVKRLELNTTCKEKVLKQVGSPYFAAKAGAADLKVANDVVNDAVSFQLRFAQRSSTDGTGLHPPPGRHNISNDKCHSFPSCFLNGSYEKY